MVDATKEAAITSTKLWSSPWLG